MFFNCITIQHLRQHHSTSSQCPPLSGPMRLSFPSFFSFRIFQSIPSIVRFRAFAISSLAIEGLAFIKSRIKSPVFTPVFTLVFTLAFTLVFTLVFCFSLNNFRHKLHPERHYLGGLLGGYLNVIQNNMTYRLSYIK